MWRQNRQMTNLAIGRKWLVAAVIAAVLLFLFASDNPLVNQVFARYGKESDPRLTRLWPDSWFALKSSFPFGTGLGTFQQAFEQVERLEILAPGYPNRAHMDFIEFIMETGAAGIVVLGLAAVILFRRIASSRYAPGKFWQDRAAMAAWAIVLVVVMHSLFDYPLRAMTLAVLFGVSCGLLWANKSGIKL
jgi:O-antigen ligase